MSLGPIYKDVSCACSYVCIGSVTIMSISLARDIDSYIIGPSKSIRTSSSQPVIQCLGSHFLRSLSFSHHAAISKFLGPLLSLSVNFSFNVKHDNY